MTALIVILALCGVSVAIGAVLRSTASAYPTVEELEQLRTFAGARRGRVNRVHPTVAARRTDQDVA